MVAKMDELGFGNCTNTRACEAVCPKNESIANIARLNREFIKAKLADKGHSITKETSIADYLCNAFFILFLARSLNFLSFFSFIKDKVITFVN